MLAPSRSSRAQLAGNITCTLTFHTHTHTHTHTRLHLNAHTHSEFVSCCKGSASPQHFHAFRGALEGLDAGRSEAQTERLQWDVRRGLDIIKNHPWIPTTGPDALTSIRGFIYDGNSIHTHHTHTSHTCYIHIRTYIHTCTHSLTNKHKKQ